MHDTMQLVHRQAIHLPIRDLHVSLLAAGTDIGSWQTYRWTQSILRNLDFQLKVALQQTLGQLTECVSVAITATIQVSLRPTEQRPGR